MAQTLEQINALRSFKGEEPLTELQIEGNASTETSTDVKPEVVAEIKPEITETKSEEVKPEENKAKEVAATATTDLTDDAVKAFLKSKGIEVNSFDDLKPKEVELDPIKVAEQKEAAKLSFALGKGLISKTEYDNFTRDSADPKQLVYAEYYAEAKADDTELTDEEIQQNFIEDSGLGADPKSLKFKTAIRSISAQGKEKLKEKYAKVFAIDAAYDSHENEISSQSAYNKKILSEAPVYKAAVEKVFSNLPKYSVPFSDTEVYEAEYPAEIVEEVKALMLKEETVKSKIENGFDETNIMQMAQMILLQKSFAAQTQKIAKEYLLKNQKGAHGIPDADRKIISEDKYANLTENQKKALSYLVPDSQPTAN